MLHVMRQRVELQLSPGRDFAWLIDMKHLSEDAPARAAVLLGPPAASRARPDYGYSSTRRISSLASSSPSVR